MKYIQNFRLSHSNKRMGNLTQDGRRVLELILKKLIFMI